MNERILVIGAGMAGLWSAMALARADREWLGKLVTRREAPADFKQALARQPDDIKVVIQFAEV